MSIQFNQTSSPYRGLVQFYEKEIGANYGDVSGNTTLLAEFTARCNNALDDYFLLLAKSAGTWQGDDINQTDYPIITSNITSGQRDYPFDEDVDGNKIKDVQKVLILQSSTATQYEEITPIDELRTELSDILRNTNTGVPFQYGKLSNGIFLDPVPNYSVALGIKMIVNREGSSFLTTDTTKKPGVPVYHEYFYLKPAFEVASIKGLGNLRELERKIVDLEGSERLGIQGKIIEFFSTRSKDEVTIMSNEQIIYE